MPALFGETTNQPFSKGGEFGAFLARTDQKANIANYVGRTLHLLSSGVFNPAEPITILDVGCGEGTLTLLLLKKFQEAGFKDIRLIGIDPSDAMTSKLQQTVQSECPGVELHVITDKFFDRASGTPPITKETIETAQCLMFCSHAIYYANDLPKATQEMIEVLPDNGVALFIHQSGTSQMHILRDRHSFGAHTKRHNNVPVNSDHVAEVAGTEKSASFLYQSNVTLVDYPIAIRDLIESGKPRNTWSEHFAYLGFSDEQISITSRDVAVLEFILRGSLDEEKAALTFLNDVIIIMEQNGSPRIIIDETMVFVPGKLALLPQLTRTAEELRHTIHATSVPIPKSEAKP